MTRFFFYAAKLSILTQFAVSIGLHATDYLDMCPDEIILRIAASTFMDKYNLNDLNNLSRVNKRLKTICKDQHLSKLVQDCYFKNYPTEYYKGQFHIVSLSMLRAKIISHQKVQHQEFKRLNENVIQLEKITEIPLNAELEQLMCQSTVKNNQLHAYNMYKLFEKRLDEINDDIIVKCLATSVIVARTGGVDQIEERQHIIDLNNMLTRLPVQSIKLLSGQAKDDRVINKVIILSKNQMKWLPKELFLIKHLIMLDITNNDIVNLPDAIKNCNQTLVKLLVGNYNTHTSRFVTYDTGTNEYIREVSNNFFPLSPPKFTG